MNLLRAYNSDTVGWSVTIINISEERRKKKQSKTAGEKKPNRGKEGENREWRGREWIWRVDRERVDRGVDGFIPHSLCPL